MTSGDGVGRRVGFVGLGRMGIPMATRLAAAGFTVCGYDVSPAARAALDAVTGASSTDELVAVAEGAEFVILMLPGSPAVEAVVHGGGLFEALEPDAVLVDMSSSVPARTRALAADAEARGRAFLDAPVSGGVRGAVEGTLTVMVGGQSDVLARARPVLEPIGSRILHAGGPGAGHAVKALNNLMSASHLLASSEAMLAGTAFGLDPSVILDVVNGSSGRSGSTQTKWPDFVLSESYASGFSMELMVKDIGIALDLAQQVGAPAKLTEQVVALWSEALASLPAGADHTEIVRWLESGEEQAVGSAALSAARDGGELG